MNQIRYLAAATLLLLLLWGAASFLNLILRTHAAPPAAQTATAATTGTAPAPTGPAAEGKAIFQQNCQTCHALDKDLTGPALRNFTARGPWADRKEVYKWVHNPAAYIQKDPYAKALQQKYGAVMQAFPQLTEAQIDAIVAYVELQ
ncbi:cytochrome c [Flaviaesturariibacter amylovorans]|uniref:Cytochrome c domain-containing protein n=1 Tax=Flaviaesturariibacter amylovorans TaxID=1084520 RepID=A0ABP8HVM1_9BACT